MDSHIVFARHLDGPERGQSIEDEAAIAASLQGPAPAWLHMRADHPGAAEWIDQYLPYLDPAIRAALTEPQTRPRALRGGDGMLLFLRGINLNEGADPEDMVSLRMYVDTAQVVSLSRRPLQSVELLANRIAAGEGPETSADLIADLVEEITTRIETQVADLESRAETLEAAAIKDPRPELSAEVTDQRLELADLRRFLPAQRDALRDALRLDLELLGPSQAAKLHEQLDQLTRVIETMDTLREQLATIRSEIEGARDERFNRNLYVLSMISAVFLPLSFMTGLMGINLAGMPGAAWTPAFWVFCALMAALAVGVLAILRIFRLI